VRLPEAERLGSVLLKEEAEGRVRMVRKEGGPREEPRDEEEKDFGI
jgi:hypothetical protein